MPTRESTATPKSNAAPSARRLRYFWIAQAVTLVCALISGIAVSERSQLIMLLIAPGVIPLCILLAIQGPVAAIVGLFRPAIVPARIALLLYGVAALIPLLGRLNTGVTATEERESQARLYRIADVISAGRWDEFDAAVGNEPIPERTLEQLAIACGHDRLPPLAVFVRIAEANRPDPTLLTTAGALCGEDHVRWALAHGGSVAPKHGVATSPLAFARDDRVYALLTAAGAALTPNPKFPDEPPPLFYAYNAAALKRMVDGGADPRALDGAGDGALHHAPCRLAADFCIQSAEFETERIKALLALGLSPDLKNKSGKTPLHTRIDDNDPLDITRELLRGGADPNQTDEEGRTVLHRLSEETRTQLREEGLIGPVPR